MRRATSCGADAKRKRCTGRANHANRAHSGADQTRLRNRAPLSVTATALQSVGSGIKPIATAVDRTRNRLTALEDIETASRSLYQSLQADQKTMADLRMAEFLTPLLRT